MPTVKNQIHRGNYKESYKGTDGKTADKSFGDGLNGVRAGAGEEGDGDHA